MLRPFFLLLLLCIATGNARLNAQTIINKYAAVLSRSPCSNILVVDTATDFEVGDTVLMIQMKGAVIDTSNTANFGTVLDYRGAGNYEYNVISIKNGNQLTMRYTIMREYNIPDGKVQLVSVPHYQNYSINQLHTCMPWNGSKGGVFVIDVADTLTFNNNIDVSGKGFRGATNTPSFSAPIVCDITSFYMSPNIDSSGMKGEGVATTPVPRSYGRGKLGNGGGGGNAHNGGGGGGSNGGAGGRGGSQFRGCNSNPNVNITGGQGGTALPYSNTSNKIFMGGGGGSSQSNNNTTTTGGNGGGICIITAQTVNGNARDLKANGGYVSACVNTGGSGMCHDGMAGGGAGGTILMNTNSQINVLHVYLMGGGGGNVSSNAVYDEVGPGGGGAGGVFWAKSATTLPGIIPTTMGGNNGEVQYNNSAWGAEPGQAGQSLNNLVFNFPTDTFQYDIVKAGFSDSAISCFTLQFTDTSTAVTSNVVTWFWYFPNQTSPQQHPSVTFPGYGTYYVSLYVTAGNGCKDSITKEVTIPYIHFADAGDDTVICPGSQVLLQASGGIAYTWAPAAGLSHPDSAATLATLTHPATYIVTVTDAKGCTDTDTVSISTNPGQPVQIVADGTVINCDQRTALLSASGAATYKWSPGIYCDDANSAAPRVSPPVTTLFTVTATNAEGCISEDTITVFVYSDEAEIFVPNAFSPNNDGLNDEIGPVILCGFTLEQFSIFNRWGQKVFTGHGPYPKWNGMYQEKQAELSTYYYYISGKKDDGSTLSFKGDFTLIR